MHRRIIVIVVTRSNKMGTAAAFLTTETLGIEGKARGAFAVHRAWCRTDVQAGSAEGSKGFGLSPHQCPRQGSQRIVWRVRGNFWS